MRRETYTEQTAALNAGGYTAVGTVPIGATSAVLTIDDASAATLKIGGGAVFNLPAGGSFVVWAGPAELGEALAVTAKASAGTPNGVLVHTIAASLP